MIITQSNIEDEMVNTGLSQSASVKHDDQVIGVHKRMKHSMRCTRMSQGEFLAD
uniref:Chromatin structure-remodeling complex protein BSH n=1 Tax=Rhizophora mucronata TaxID=61149 RepID=A0A2P2L8P4_RHIMU